MKFDKKYIYPILFLILISGFVLKSKAQSNMAFYPIENQFNSSAYNPAFLTSDAQFTFSIFPLAGTNLGFNNQKEIQSLVSKLTSGLNNDTEYIDILKDMVKQPTFNQKLESDLLSFTYRSPLGFMNFRIRENVAFSASVKGPVSEFMILPEVQSVVVGQPQDIPIQFIHYREYSLAYSLPPVHRRLSAGIRAKLYFGKGVFSSTISGSIQNQSGTYLLKTGGKGYMSMPEDSVTNSYGSTNSLPSFSSIGNYLMNSGNPGIGVDLGIKYKITPKVSVSLSIIDLGKISWKTNLNSKIFDGEYSFKDTSITHRIDNGLEIISKTSDSVSFTNSFSNVFKLSYVRTRFSTPLPVTFFTGLNYQVSPTIKISLVDRYIRLKNMNHNSFSVSANFDITPQLTVNTGYSIIGDAYNNVPLAILLNRNFGQIYVGTDNVLAFLSLLTFLEFSGITFGACFYLFRKRKLYDQPTETFPFFKSKKVKKIPNNGRILKETTEFGFPEQH